MPGCGSSRVIRHRNGCERSCSVGCLNALIFTPCGSTMPIACRMTPPLPEVSMPWSTTSTLGAPSSPARPAAYRRSWRSASSASIAVRAAGASALPFPGKPGVDRVSSRPRATGPGGSRSRSLSGGGAAAFFFFFCFLPMATLLLFLTYGGIVPYAFVAACEDGARAADLLAYRSDAGTGVERRSRRSLPPRTRERAGTRAAADELHLDAGRVHRRGRWPVQIDQHPE